MVKKADSGDRVPPPAATRHAARPPAPDHAAKLRAEVVAFSLSLVGIHEQPPHSNDGPSVHRIQSATRAYREPWCVSTVQYEDVHVGLGLYANGTAGAYYYAEYAHEHGHVVAHPVAGCAVIYHLGQGHAGRIVHVLSSGAFYAVEGNEADAVRQVLRDPRHLGCTYVLRPEYRG